MPTVVRNLNSANIVNADQFIHHQKKVLNKQEKSVRDIGHGLVLFSSATLVQDVPEFVEGILKLVDKTAANWVKGHINTSVFAHAGIALKIAGAYDFNRHFAAAQEAAKLAGDDKKAAAIAIQKYGTYGLLAVFSTTAGMMCGIGIPTDSFLIKLAQTGIILTSMASAVALKAGDTKIKLIDNAAKAAKAASEDVEANAVTTKEDPAWKVALKRGVALTEFNGAFLLKSIIGLVNTWVPENEKENNVAREIVSNVMNGAAVFLTVRSLVNFIFKQVPNAQKHLNQNKELHRGVDKFISNLKEATGRAIALKAEATIYNVNKAVAHKGFEDLQKNTTALDDLVFTCADVEGSNGKNWNISVREKTNEELELTR